MSFVVNPFTEYHDFSDELAEFRITSPKKNFGLKSLIIRKSEYQHIFELCTTVQLPFWDLENDLTEPERELLIEYGVLVEKDNVPQMPLFACQLNDVIPTEIIPLDLDLFVNPTFRYEPLNIAYFASWMKEKHWFPQQNTAWIKSPATDIETGLWLNQQQSEIVKTFVAGQPINQQIDSELLGKLISAEILISSDLVSKKSDDFRAICNNGNLNFNEKKYCVIKSLLSKHHMRALANFYREYVKNGFMALGDEQVPNRFIQHNEPLAKQLHNNFQHIISNIVGKPVKPSYVYAAAYKNSADLMPHVDREQCEYSISFQVDYTPETSDGISPWSLYVQPLAGKNFGWDIAVGENDFDSNRAAVNLANGDGLFYKGRELVHYRYALPENHTSTSLFFHYVDEDFDGFLN